MMDTVKKIQDHIAKRKTYLSIPLAIYQKALAEARYHKSTEVRDILVRIYNADISRIESMFFELNAIEKIINEKSIKNGA